MAVFLEFGSVRLPLEEGTLRRTDTSSAPTPSASGTPLLERRKLAFRYEATTVILSTAEAEVVAAQLERNNGSAFAVVTGAVFPGSPGVVCASRVLEVDYVSFSLVRLKLELIAGML